jgi:hypothetical protein
MQRLSERVSGVLVVLDIEKIQQGGMYKWGG